MKLKVVHFKETHLYIHSIKPWCPGSEVGKIWMWKRAVKYVTMWSVLNIGYQQNDPIMNETPMNRVGAQKADVSELLRSPARSTEPSGRRADCVPVWLRRAYSKMEAFAGMWLHCSVLALLLCSVANLLWEQQQIMWPCWFLQLPAAIKAGQVDPLHKHSAHKNTHLFLLTYTLIQLQTG